MFRFQQIVVPTNFLYLVRITKINKLLNDLLLTVANFHLLQLLDNAASVGTLPLLSAGNVLTMGPQRLACKIYRFVGLV